MQKIAFTLCSNNYLAQAKTLGDSLLKHNSDIYFIIGLVDKLDPAIDYSFFRPHEILAYSDLNFREFDGMVERYNIVEFNTAVKPYYIDYFFASYPECTVYYIDPDIEIFDSFEDLSEILAKGYDFILTPHLVEPRIEQSKFEKQVLNVGIYNLGFITIKKSIISQFFVDWWKARLEFDCKINFGKGLFVDQIWINYLPSFYDNVFILRDPGYNMGYWNFAERTLSTHDGRFIVNEQYRLRFFHFSNFNPLSPTVLCKYLDYSFEARPDLVEIYKNYAATLLNNQYEKLSSVKRQLNFKRNHPQLDKKASTIQRMIISLKKKFRLLLNSLS
jgi:hypothetical protein